jgi:tripartite-type tricarboxylate transporter receptor subunit TctC
MQMHTAPDTCPRVLGARQLCAMVGVAACTLSAATETQAQSPAMPFPNRPVRFIVPFPPGGGADVIGRVLGQKLTDKWGQQVVIDNRAGAGGNVAAELAAAAPADGHTLYQFNIANAIAPSLYKKLKYDPVRDFDAVTLLAKSPFILVVHPSVHARNVQELVALARAQPGKLTYASSGNGGPSHLAAEMLKAKTRIQMTHVPYKGVALVMNDLLAGQIQLTFTVPGSGMPQVRAGRLRALAVSTARRSNVVPELPTIAESGVPGYDTATWYAVVVPAGTARPIIGKLHADITQALQLPDVGNRLVALGADIIGSTPEELREFIRSEIVTLGRLR